MPALHDAVTKADLPAQSGYPRLATLIDKERDLRFYGPEGIPEPVNGWVWKWCIGDGATLTFSLPTLPANVAIVNTFVAVSGTAGTAAATVAIGKSGSTGAYQTASSFTSSMATAGVKPSTTIKGYEPTAITPLATFASGGGTAGAWDTGAKCLVGVQYAKLPSIPAS